MCATQLRSHLVQHIACAREHKRAERGSQKSLEQVGSVRPTEDDLLGNTGRYRNENKTIACKSKVFSGNKTENETALNRRREKDDQIESHRGGSPKTLANGSENLLGNSDR